MTEPKWIEIARLVADLQHKAGVAGMFRTMHALHEANRIAGFEAAEKISEAMGKRP